MSRLQAWGDKIAIFLSSLCLIHCLATPVLLVVLPSLNGLHLLAHHTFHTLLLFFVVPVGLLALIFGFNRHHNKFIFSCGLFGLVLLAIAALFGHEYLGIAGETAMTIAASVLIVFAHYRNFQFRCHSI